MSFKEKINPYIPAGIFIRYSWYTHFHKSINLRNPHTFNEKIQWLKLHDHNSKYTLLADKYRVKDYIENKLGANYVIPTLGVWSSTEDFMQRGYVKMPDSFVLKCTHNSGGTFIIYSKNNTDWTCVRKEIESQLSSNFYYVGREWAYKNIQPRLIAEPYISDSEHDRLTDYKYYCFNGIPKLILVCSGRQADGSSYQDYYDTDWNHLNLCKSNHTSSPSWACTKPPSTGDEMLYVASVLSEGIPFCRVDLYSVQDNVLFGEITFYPMGGFEEFVPKEWNYKIGEWIHLNQ